MITRDCNSYYTDCMKTDFKKLVYEVEKSGENFKIFQQFMQSQVVNIQFVTVKVQNESLCHQKTMYQSIQSDKSTLGLTIDQEMQALSPIVRKPELFA